MIVPPDLQQKGWRIDTEALKTPGYKWIADKGGDPGSCRGFDPATLSPNGFQFIVDYGHTTNNVGAKGDASQNCGLTVPIIQVTDIEIAGPSASGNITWTSDEKIDLDASRAVSFVLSQDRFCRAGEMD